jgi:hypothetical protein
VENQTAGATGARTPVVVELFTSEGCSSCPPADELLRRLEQTQPVAGAEVIALGFHVDYWDGEGWHDRFSSAEYTWRQQEYARRLRTKGPYTPEMVIDGRDEFVGNDAQHARAAIAKAAQSPKAAVQLRSEGDKLVVESTGDTKAEVWLAIAEDDLSTSVKGGENGGRELHHSAVVRSLTRIGKVKEKGFTTTVQPKLDAKWRRDKLRAVVFLARPGTGEILGAAAVALR